MKPAPRVIYIAGPYSPATSLARENNVRRAEAVALDLWKASVPTICVHTLARYAFGDVPEETALACDLAILNRCDAVMLVTGWPHSKGTIAEMRHAATCCKPIFAPESLDACIRWAFTGDVEPHATVPSGWWLERTAP
jgi:hypothetical protein